MFAWLQECPHCGYVASKLENELEVPADLLQEEMPPIDWPSMGRYVYLAKFKSKTDMEDYFKFILD